MAEWHYCWRCGKSVPMLREEEWEEVLPLLRSKQVQVKRYREKHGASLPEALLAVRSIEAQEMVQKLTGYYEPNADAIWHHRMAGYGPACCVCGHLLRTKRARYCANCGAAGVRPPLMISRTPHQE
jgi:hypothetical protein